MHVTGPAATVADLTVAGEQDRLPIEIAIGVLVLLVLLVVYRNPVTMLLPLAAIGTSLVDRTGRGGRGLRTLRTRVFQTSPSYF